MALIDYLYKDSDQADSRLGNNGVQKAMELYNKDATVYNCQSDILQPPKREQKKDMFRQRKSETLWLTDPS